MEEKIYDVPSEWSHRAYLDDAGYQAKYEASIRNPDAFWAEEAKRIHWFKAADPDQEHQFRPRRRLDPLVRGRRHQRRL